MTPDERKAHARAEAQKRIAERMAALGLQAPSSSTPKVDTSVEERLAKEKQEAEEKQKVQIQVTELWKPHGPTVGLFVAAEVEYVYTEPF